MCYHLIKCFPLKILSYSYFAYLAQKKKYLFSSLFLSQNPLDIRHTFYYYSLRLIQEQNIILTALLRRLYDVRLHGDKRDEEKPTHLTNLRDEHDLIDDSAFKTNAMHFGRLGLPRELNSSSKYCDYFRVRILFVLTPMQLRYRIFSVFINYRINALGAFLILLSYELAVNRRTLGGY